MPLFMIERRYADRLEVTDEGLRLVEEANLDAGVRWLYSFLTADGRNTYCVYDAPSPEAIREAASRAGLPADMIVEVSALGPGGATAVPHQEPSPPTESGRIVS